MAWFVEEVDWEEVAVCHAVVAAQDKGEDEHDDCGVEGRAKVWFGGLLKFLVLRRAFDRVHCSERRLAYSAMCVRVIEEALVLVSQRWQWLPTQVRLVVSSVSRS